MHGYVLCRELPCGQGVMEENRHWRCRGLLVGKAASLGWLLERPAAAAVVSDDPEDASVFRHGVYAAGIGPTSWFGDKDRLPGWSPVQSCGMVASVLFSIVFMLLLCVAGFLALLRAGTGNRSAGRARRGYQYLVGA